MFSNLASLEKISSHLIVLTPSLHGGPNNFSNSITLISESQVLEKSVTLYISTDFDLLENTSLITSYSSSAITVLLFCIY